jgi:hypothetical protein
MRTDLFEKRKTHLMGYFRDSTIIPADLRFLKISVGNRENWSNQIPENHFTPAQRGKPVAVY